MRWPWSKPEFERFESIPRLTRPVIITEKIDGTNASVYVTERGKIYAGSRNRWLTVKDDNYGFATWVKEHESELLRLGVGRHYGEWWGRGIGKRYPKQPKTFSLFNVSRWRRVADEVAPGRPWCCDVVPVISEGMFDTRTIDLIIEELRGHGSLACPGAKAEGIVVYHVQGDILFKKTLDKDESPKSQVETA